MNAAAVAERDRFDRTAFHRDFWRRAAVVYRGAATRLLDPPLDHDDAAALVAAARRHAATSVAQRPDGTVTFVNQVQHVSPRLRVASRAVDAALGWAGTTFDLSVSTTAGVGIGPHFDHSDNLVLQQQGSKTWHVGPPEDTDSAQRRARMLELPDHLPTARVPRCAAVVLHPGDMLYLPLFAPHEGIADGPSVSVSASFNAESALSVLGAALLTQLRRDPAWWAPLPLDAATAPRDLLERTGVAALRQVLDRYLGTP
ncbi:MAG: JmjC domain-containing protein [Pseudonocardia sp.]